MTTRSDYVFLEVDGRRVDSWIDYRIDSDILTPADAFSMTFALGGGAAGRRAFDELRELCAPLTRVELYTGFDVTGGPRQRALLFSGVIDRLQIPTSRSAGTSLIVQGRDRAAYLVDSAAPIGLVRSLGADATLMALARVACAPWNIEVIAEASTAREVATGLAAQTPNQRLIAERALREGVRAALLSSDVVRKAQREGRPLDQAGLATLNTTGREAEAQIRAQQRARRRSASGMTGSDIERLTLDEASPHSGETVWSFLARHCERLGVMMFMDPRGRLILGSPDYASDPLYRFVLRRQNEPSDPNNVQAMTVEYSGADRFSRVKVIGRTHGRGAARSRVTAVVEDPDMPFVRERTEQDRSVRTEEQAQRMAKRLAREGIASAEVITIHADDHGQGRLLYTPNTTANVVNEYAGIEGRRYITSRTFTRSREAGTSTELHLVQLDSLTL